MKQEKRLAIIKASIQSLEERYPDLDWKAFKKDIRGFATFKYKVYIAKSPYIFDGWRFLVTIYPPLSVDSPVSSFQVKATAQGYMVYSPLKHEPLFDRLFNRLTAEPLQESLREEINSLLFTVIMYTWQNQFKLEKALKL